MRGAVRSSAHRIPRRPKECRETVFCFTAMTNAWIRTRLLFKVGNPSPPRGRGVDGWLRPDPPPRGVPPAPLDSAGKCFFEGFLFWLSNVFDSCFSPRGSKRRLIRTKTSVVAGFQAPPGTFGRVLLPLNPPVAWAPGHTIPHSFPPSTRSLIHPYPHRAVRSLLHSSANDGSPSSLVSSFRCVLLFPCSPTPVFRWDLLSPLSIPLPRFPSLPPLPPLPSFLSPSHRSCPCLGAPHSYTSSVKAAPPSVHPTTKNFSRGGLTHNAHPPT